MNMNMTMMLQIYPSLIVVARRPNPRKVKVVLRRTEEDKVEGNRLKP